MKFALFLIALVFANINLNNAQCVVETDTDFLGAPLSNDLSTIQASSFQDCCNKCNAQSEANCAAWTFSGGFCFLKSGPGLRTRSVGKTSGLRQVTVVRSDATSITISVKTLFAFTALVNMIAFKCYF